MKERVAPVSVVICTRDRPDDLRRCLERLAALDPRPAEVIVVDQSSKPFVPEVGDLPIRPHASNERGAARARNAGLGLAASDVIAFLDDDCLVQPTWIADIMATFARHPEAGMVFGSVVAPRYDPDAYVPIYEVARERSLKGRMDAYRAHGISAAVYIRASAATRVGGFDTWLGPGSKFHNSEDWDYTFRALAAGVEVIETPQVVVEHLGARRYSDGSAARLLRVSAYSHGAVHAKLLRCLDPIALVLIGSELVELVKILRPFDPIVRRPTNAARLLKYFQGFVAGLRAPVMRRQRIFGNAAVGSDG